MEQGALGAVSVRRAGYGLEVGRSVRRTAGGAGALCRHAHTAACCSCSTVFRLLSLPSSSPDVTY